MSRNELMPRKAWEGPAALLCGVSIWLNGLLQAFQSTRFGAQQLRLPILIFIVGTAFGIGFAISALRRGGGKNRLFATLALIIISPYFFIITFFHFVHLLRD